ncbi:unnamed protein product [Trichobilharzia regenti]|nr:unnamed protein product [Trichobilharzia regenti]
MNDMIWYHGFRFDLYRSESTSVFVRSSLHTRPWLSSSYQLKYAVVVAVLATRLGLWCVIGSLQPLHPEQYIMHHQAGVLRQQQEMVVLNPQTGEVLNDRYSASTTAITTATTNTSHHFARNLTSNDTVVTTGGNVNGPSSGASAGGLDRCRQAYNMFECQMAQLTVFLDRALICRRIRPRFNASEITEVLFEHLSPAIDKDSIRYWHSPAIFLFTNSSGKTVVP